MTYITTTQGENVPRNLHTNGPAATTYQDTPRNQKAVVGNPRLVLNNVHLRTGLPCQDAKEDVTIVVTQADAKAAVRKDPRNCAFSVACRRQVEGIVDVEFFLTRAFLIYKDHVDRFTMPLSTQKEVVIFDRTGGFQEGEYWLTAPCASNSMGYKAPKDSKNPGHKPYRPKVSRRLGGVRVVAGPTTMPVPT